MLKIKNLLLSIVMSSALGALACFDSNPDSVLEFENTTLVGGGGSMIEIPHQPSPGFDAESWLSQFQPPAESEKLTKIEPAAAIRAATPYTLNLTFSGFIDAQGGTSGETITRMTLFYYAKGGGWTILADIQNPGFVAIDEKARPLFGRNTIPNRLGYSAGEYIPVVIYFENSAGQSSFDLDTFLSYRQYLGAPNYVTGAQVVAIVVTGNARPQ